MSTCSYFSTDLEDVIVRRSIASKGYMRKSCKKAKAASLSIFDDSEDSSGVLCEGVGAETCYPPTRIRRHTRGFCGDLGHATQNTQVDIGPTQVGDTFVGEKIESDIEETTRCLENALAESLLQEGKVFMTVSSNRSRTNPESDDDASGRLGLWERVRKRLRHGARWLIPPRKNSRSVRTDAAVSNRRVVDGLSAGDQH